MTRMRIVALGLLLAWAGMFGNSASAEQAARAKGVLLAAAAADVADGAAPAGSPADEKSAPSSTLTSPAVVLTTIGGLVLLVGLVIVVVRVVGKAPDLWDAYRGRPRSSRRSLPPAAMVAFDPSAKPAPPSEPAARHRAA